ncbi:MAG TPA: ATP-binding protein [Gemmatimonadaceae bacterium]|nr:ATP-binding protein [Gemmatimonadaceae bacterium]
MADKAENHPLSNRRPKPEEAPNGGKTPITPLGKSRLAEAIRHGGRIYQTMVESVRDYAIFLLDPGGYIATWNVGAERLKGYTADEIVGQHFSVFYPPEAIAIGHPRHELETATKEGRYEEEGWRIRKDGTAFWANVVITAVRDETGELIGFAKVTRDLTERRNAELRAIADARRLAQAESANIAKSEFLTAMSHELRTPLNAIGGYTELLSLGLGGPITSEQNDYLERIRRSQQHLMHIISDLLNFSRIEAGQLTYDIAAFPLRDTIIAVVPLIEPQAKAKGVALTAAIDDQECVALGDRGKVDQILLNLLSNAVKFTNAGGSVRISCKAENNFARISVTDTGVGIPAQKAEAIFEPFVQLGRSLSSAHEGTGLGLAISRDLARAMNGDLTVTSMVGAGSTFTLSLPHPRSETEQAPVKRAKRK